MMKNISAWIQHYSSGRAALLAMVIFLLFTALVLPGQASNGAAGGESAGSPDLSLYYSAGDLYRMAESYGEAGRRAYVRARFTFDLVWPLVYTLFLCTGISWLFQRVYPRGSSWQLANLVPVVGALFDYLENISTSLVMLRYPAPTPLVAELAGVFTLLKWIYVAGSFILLLLGAAAGIWLLVRKGRNG